MAEKVIFERTRALKDVPTIFCPGCGHGILLRLVAEVVDEMGLRGRTVGVAPVGCAVTAYDYWDFDVTEAAHGRPPAVASGIKRVLPDRLVFTYQGDGDLAAIGTAETIHAAARGELLTTIFVNNGVYGMTSGQMAPTTLPGQKTTTSVGGRDPLRHGNPIRVGEMLATLEGVVYIERLALTDPAAVRAVKRAIGRGFRCQLDGHGYSLIEVLSPCPVNWGLSPVDSLAYIGGRMAAFFPPGVIKDTVGVSGRRA